MNRLQYLSHSFFLAESTYPASVNPHRRRDGGLLLLTSTTIRPNISVLSTSSYHIKIKLKNSILPLFTSPQASLMNLFSNHSMVALHAPLTISMTTTLCLLLALCILYLPPIILFSNTASNHPTGSCIKRQK